MNAAHARHLKARRLLLIGRVDQAEQTLAGLDLASFPPLRRAAHEDTPAAYLIARGKERLVLLDEVEALLGSDTLVVDACRRIVHAAGTIIPLGTRPVLFALARALGGRSLARRRAARHAARAGIPGEVRR